MLEKYFLPVPSITPSPQLIAGLDAKVLLEVQQTNRMSLRCAECYVGPVFPQGKLVQGENSPILSPSLTVLGNFTAVSSMHGIPPGDHLSTDINSSKSCCRCCNLLDPTKPWKFSDKTKWNSEGSTNRFPGETPIYFKISELGFWWCLQSDIKCCRAADVPNHHSYHLKSSKPIDKM